MSNSTRPFATNDLRDIDEVEPFGSADQACFQEIRQVLVKHGALRRFGITLLHKHFELDANEVLVEFCDHDTRTLMLKPVKRGDVSDDQIMETNWRLDKDAVVAACYCHRSGGRHTGHESR